MENDQNLPDMESNEFIKLFRACEELDKQHFLTHGSHWNAVMMDLCDKDTREKVKAFWEERTRKGTTIANGDVSADTIEALRRDYGLQATPEYMSIRGYHCHGALDFSYHIFPVDIDFNDSVFEQSVSFKYVRFEKVAVFNRAEFKSLLTFYDAEFKYRSHFLHTRFGDNLSFNSTKFTAFPPNMSGAILPQAFTIFNCKWPPTIIASQATYHSGMYQVLASHMKALDRHSDRVMFMALEQRARRVDDIAILRGDSEIADHKSMFDWFTVGISWLYDWVCGYGYNIGLVVKRWWQFIGLGWAALFISLICSKKESLTLSLSGVRTVWEAFVNSLAVSLSNAHGFLGLQRGPLKDIYPQFEKIFYFQTLWTVQAIFGPILLFLLLLTIRNRFRMS